ncbi:TIGR03545 family protein [Thalassomonas haliotis]|uniref:TIGR03545 family protein n=1 Tax=Thalassomonas haliotis TaxID=485448 RepID=A0ABY7VKV1_9GAMM|nr:TIGR03545 family protein [Thalassomonas haliotis]WDE13676.1 TIGR03545 family protein [Thalassomonas haliotis]
MSSLIRWPGLLAFFIISILLTGIMLIFLDLWLKIAVTEGLEQAIGAEVNIASVSHNFSPLAISLKQLEMTDAEQPEFNQLQASSVQVQLRVAPLLLHKVIIETLTIDDLQFNQPRKSPGQVYRQPLTFTADSLEKLIPQTPQLPGVEDILAKSPLKTTQAINNTREAYARHNKVLTQQYRQLPDQSKLEDYQKELKRLTTTDYKDPLQLASATKQFNQLQRQLKQEQQKLADFKTSITRAKKELTLNLAALKAAPEQDYEQLKGLLAGDEAALHNITALIFGEQVAKWNNYLLSAYQILAPVLSKQQQKQAKTKLTPDRRIAFDDTAPLPDLLIKKAKVSLKWQDEVIDSFWQDITYEHDKIARPTRFTLESAKSPLWQSLQVEGDLWLTDNQIKARQNWDLRELKLTGLTLVAQEKLNSALKQGLLSSSGGISVKNNQLSGNANIELGKLTLSAWGKDTFTNTLASTLKQLKQLSITAELSGPVNTPKVDFSSDLDKQLTAAMLANLGPEQQAKQEELKQKLTARSQGPLTENQANMSQWLNWQQLGDNSQNQVQEMLSTQLKSAKGKNKLEKLFKGKFPAADLSIP